MEKRYNLNELTQNDIDMLVFILGATSGDTDTLSKEANKMYQKLIRFKSVNLDYGSCHLDNIRLPKWNDVRSPNKIEIEIENVNINFGNK